MCKNEEASQSNANVGFWCKNEAMCAEYNRIRSDPEKFAKHVDMVAGVDGRKNPELRDAQETIIFAMMMYDQIKDCRLPMLSLNEIKTEEQLEKVADCIIKGHRLNIEPYHTAQKEMISACILYQRDFERGKDESRNNLRGVYSVIYLGRVAHDDSGKTALEALFEEKVPKDSDAYRHFLAFSEADADIKREVIEDTLKLLDTILGQRKA